jgi:hypothetical protein
MARRYPPRSRRKIDRTIVRTLFGAVVFLFVVNVVLAAYVINTLPRVDRNAKAVTVFTCTQNAAFRAAYDRERELAKTVRTKTGRRTHRKSARSLKEYLETVDKIVDCKRVKVLLPPHQGH